MKTLGVQYYRPPNPQRRHWAGDLAAIKAHSIDSVRTWLYWRTTERVPGRFDWSDYDAFFEAPAQAGLRVVVQLVPEVQPAWHLPDALEEAGMPGFLARREAKNIELVGELIASEGRTLLAVQAYHDQDWTLLRRTIAEEIGAWERQLEISGRLGWGGGVNPVLVREDIQNMLLYLSSDDFPNTLDDSFHFSSTLYSS